jgi:hypothetical protein
MSGDLLLPRDADEHMPVAQPEPLRSRAAQAPGEWPLPHGSPPAPTGAPNRSSLPGAPGLGLRRLDVAVPPANANQGVKRAADRSDAPGTSKHPSGTVVVEDDHRRPCGGAQHEHVREQPGLEGRFDRLPRQKGRAPEPQAHRGPEESAGGTALVLPGQACTASKLLACV